MKTNSTVKLFYFLLSKMTKKTVKDSAKMKAVKEEFQSILERARDIGKSNVLLSSYVMAMYYIAMNRKDGLSPEENIKILENGLRNSKLVSMTLGNAESYLSEKRFNERVEWSRETKKKKYENDWVVDILPSNGDYEMGYDYLECGVCKLCHDENCFEYAKYLCSLDYMLIEMVGLKLKRTMTIAEGNEKCDFRFYKS